jgi:hypothetical protein
MIINHLELHTPSDMGNKPEKVQLKKGNRGGMLLRKLDLEWEVLCITKYHQ